MKPKRVISIIYRALPLAASIGTITSAHADSDMKFGIYYSDGKEACVSFNDPASADLKAVDIVQVSPGSEGTTRIQLGKRDDTCSQFATQNAAEGVTPIRFRVSALKQEQRPDMAIAVAGATDYKTSKNKLRVSELTGERLPPHYVRAKDSTGEAMSFSFCMLESAVVLTAWQGDPDTGKRLWEGRYMVPEPLTNTCRIDLPEGVNAPPGFNDSKPIYP